jgi:hypothetical protein
MFIYFCAQTCMRSAAAVFIVLPDEEEWPNIVAGFCFSRPPRKPQAANFIGFWP